MTTAMPTHLPATGVLVALLAVGLASAAVTRHSSLTAPEAEPHHPSQVSAAAALAQHSSRGTAANDHSSKISPPLKPESDLLHRVDYTQDISPHPKDKPKFGYPYPLVQDTGDYDKDYVKDENDDTGEWKAQMDYDTLRIKIEKLKARVEKAKAEEAAQKNKRDDVTAKEAAAEAESEAAEKAASSANKQESKNRKHLHEIEGKEGGAQPGGRIAQQVAEVNRQITHVEACQKELDDAQAELKRLMKLKEQRAEALAREKHAAGVDKEEAEQRAQAAREAKYKALDDEIVNKLKEEEKGYDKSVQEFRMTESEMLKTEAEFNKVAAKLRQSRRVAAGESEAYTVDPAPRSAASSSYPQLSFIATVSTLSLAALLTA